MSVKRDHLKRKKTVTRNSVDGSGSLESNRIIGKASLQIQDNGIINCHNCKQDFHYTDIDMEFKTFSSIKSLHANGVRWHCDTCLGNPVNIQTIRQEMDEFKKSVQNELSSVSAHFDSQIENQFKNFQSSFFSSFQSVQKETNEEIKSGYAAAVSKNLDTHEKTNKVMSELTQQVETLKINVESDINQKSENMVKEQLIKNVIIFKVPESQENEPDKAYQEDFNKVLDAIDPEKNLKRDDIVRFYRLEPKIKTTDTIRPIKVSLKNVELRNNILKLRNIYCKSGNETKQIFIAPDRTLQERENHKKLVAELKERKSKGEIDIMIRNGKIVSSQPFRYKPQDFWGERQ